ncbi:hypothetical protein GW17_00026072, partial [Ensete ventricosum]
GKAPYHLIHTGPTADRYADQPLPGGTTKIDRQRLISTADSRFRLSTVDFNRRRSIDGESPVGYRLKKKKGKEEEEKKKEEVHGHCPRLCAARETSPPSQLAGDYHPHAGRRNVSPRMERDRGGITSTTLTSVFVDHNDSQSLKQSTVLMKKGKIAAQDVKMGMKTHEIVLHPQPEKYEKEKGNKC